jgi:3D (Asp-Asp-Asp) domain-containing protein
MKYLILPFLLFLISISISSSATAKLNNLDLSVPKHYEKTYEEEWKEAVFSAYNLEEGQTDSTPTIGAYGDDLSRRTTCVVATRRYGKGTIIFIPLLQQRCEVLDKTSQKYANRIDILFPTKEEAINFGLQTLKYRVINE